MERALTVEEKIRRAEEIYERRKRAENGEMPIKMKDNLKSNDNRKDIKLLKKILVQLLICSLIYTTFYLIKNNEYIFSNDVLKKANEILSHDTNFMELYENIKNEIINLFNSQNKEQEEKQEEQKQEETNLNEAIGGAIETTENNNEQNETTQNQELSQEEQDINNIKNTTSFIKPIEGTISSSFGRREEATGSVPKNHTGTDIAANLGTKIKSSTDGEVVLASEEGDYGKHLKIQIGEVSIIYAHCNNLYVKQGDKVVQGQEIAEVGSTGNSTGPHLHFEIRISERTVDPQKILEL